MIDAQLLDELDGPPLELNRGESKKRGDFLVGR
jgi:hypothetical protein